MGVEVSSSRSRSKGDVVLGVVLALAVVGASSLLMSAIIVVVAALAVVTLVISWVWKNPLLRVFAVTMTAVTVLAFAAYLIPYVPYLLASLVEAIF